MIINVDPERTLVGQILPWGRGHHASGEFQVQAFGLYQAASTEWKLVVHGYGLRKDRTVGMVRRHCYLPLDNVPTVDLELLERRENENLVKAQREHGERVHAIFSALKHRALP